MDRSRRRPGLLIAGLVAAASTLAAAPSAPPLRAMRWLAPGVDASLAMERQPTECLGQARDAATAYEIELGRAAFRTPLLLGGQAARAGLSCESCHRSGRNNPSFDFPGVSGAPGTADIGTSILSSHRGGAPFAPVPIPDLSGPKSALTTDQSPASGALEARISAIATQEFDGAPPPPAALKGLAVYVRALSPAACPIEATQPVTAEAGLADVRRAVRAALAALDHRDGASAALMVEAARTGLGDVDERYVGPDLEPAREALARASDDLGAAEADARQNPAMARQALELWLAREPAWTDAVIAAEPGSLYNPARLAAATAVSSPAGDPRAVAR